MYEERTLGTTERMLHAILAYGWTWIFDRLVNRRVHVRRLTRAISSTNLVNNLTFSRSGPQVVVKDSILATATTEVLTEPCIGSIDDGARFIWARASFVFATASSMFNSAASEAFDVVAIVNSMRICVLR